MRFQRVRHDLATKQQLNYIYFSIHHGATCAGGPICLWSWRWLFVSAMWKSECLRGQDTEDVYRFISKKIKQQIISPLSFCLSLKWSPSPKIPDGESGIRDGKDTLLISRGSWELGSWFSALRLKSFSSPFVAWQPGGVPWCYLEAVQNCNIDLHQCLVLPQRGCLPHVQVHLLGHILKGEGNIDSQAGLPLGFRLKRDWASITNKILH